LGENAAVKEKGDSRCGVIRGAENGGLPPGQIRLVHIIVLMKYRILKSCYEAGAAGLSAWLDRPGQDPHRPIFAGLTAFSGLFVKAQRRKKTGQTRRRAYSVGSSRQRVCAACRLVLN
jgi:hypothetical protein